MIYDCFSFFNELDLLEIRLNVLKDVVDKFVLVEATKTHTGKDKPLYYKENAARFSAFTDRIIHIVVDDFSVVEGVSDVRERAWTIENLQRNAIIRGLDGAQNDDVLMISDLDEIPDPSVVKRAAGLPGVTRLGMKIYNYYLNYRNYSARQWMLGTQVLHYGDFMDRALYAGFKFGEFVVERVNPVPSASMVRFMKPRHVLKDAGWHFSYLGGVDAIRNKVRSIAHTEFDNGTTSTDEWIKARIAAGEDLFRRGDRYFADFIDESFPAYIIKSQQRYRHLIIPVDKECIEKTRMLRKSAALKGLVMRLVAKCIPNFLIPLAIRLREMLHGVKRV